MRAKEGVLDRLNALLTVELTATHQYLVQAEMCRQWGYERLYHQLHEYSREELDDAEHLIAHILYLEGTPDVQRLGEVQAGTSAHEQLQLDVAPERRLREQPADRGGRNPDPERVFQPGEDALVRKHAGNHSSAGRR